MYTVIYLQYDISEEMMNTETIMYDRYGIHITYILHIELELMQ